MLTDLFTSTIDASGGARDPQAQARENAGLLFDELHGQARRAQWWRRLTGQPAALRLLAGRPAPARRTGQTVSISLDEIIGSEDKAADFDADFRPLDTHSRDRWISVALARRQGRALPAVELVQAADGYYVRDGHHRISVARAVGLLSIEARFVNG
jgi:hypothetical protein